MNKARQTAPSSIECSLDLQRSNTHVEVFTDHWSSSGSTYPFPERCRPHTIYYWEGSEFAPVARYQSSLIKLVPTTWGPPTFEIDGVKMLPSAQISPYEDARHKVALIEPRGKVVLDCCAGLGYFGAWCCEGAAAQVLSFEKNMDVIWLREMNPWSPSPDACLKLTHEDICDAITRIPDGSVDAVLHDPPRFALAGELYAQAFYDQLVRVLRRRGRLFHYTGSPNKNSRGRELAVEVIKRLQIAGFTAHKTGDGVLATKA